MVVAGQPAWESAGQPVADLPGVPGPTSDPGVSRSRSSRTAANRGTPSCRASAVRWGVAGRIVWAWILTIPMSAFIAAITYYIVAYTIAP